MQFSCCWIEVCVGGLHPDYGFPDWAPVWLELGRPPEGRTSCECMRVTRSLSRIGDKWAILVICALDGRPKRFNEIKRELELVSQRMLTLTLRNLERDGLVRRTVTPTVPPRVDYELTELGYSFAEPVHALAQWAGRNLGRIEQSQSDYDRREMRGKG